MSYLRKFSSLKERASTQVAINLCQEDGFKEVALCLEKPTYGAFINGHASSFVTDPEKLSTWAKMKEPGANECGHLFNEFICACTMSDKDRKEQWDSAIDEQCERLTEGLPHFLMHDVHAWINRIALEYLSYSRRQEALFGVSRYFLMDFLTTEDWTEVGRLNEEKVAKRLLKDERLTVLQRYRIACAYCLHVNISQLWNRLTQEEGPISVIRKSYPLQESHNLVLFWLHQMDTYRIEGVTWRENNVWTHAAHQSTHYGNRAALMSCWKSLEEDIRQQIVIDMALKAVKIWQSMLYAHGSYMHYEEKLFNTSWPSTQSHEAVKHFNLPSYYTELMHFFLSEMAEEQQLTFFKKAFQSQYCDSVLESFLDWPHQDYFLPTINRLWGILPKDKYGKCVLTLASKCSGDDEKENQYYDYRSLLWMLWEETPEEYKKYMFHNKKIRNTNGFYVKVINESEILLPRLLERTPFQEKDETLFKRVFLDQPQEKRNAMMLSKVGENICSILIQKEMWSFLNWLLEKCLPKAETRSYKKQFIQSYCAHKLCCSKLEENCEKLVEDLIDWSFSLNAEKIEYKYELINGNVCFQACKTFLTEGKFTQVERLINFCLPCDVLKKLFKVRFARYTCSSLLENCKFAWERMDEVLAWSVDAEEKISDIKRDLFSDIGICSHYESVFIYREWKEVERFYEWFDLSPEEIKKLKKNTIFDYPPTIEAIEESFYDCTDSYVEPLLYCLTDRKMIFDFKQTVKEECFNEIVYKSQRKAKERLDDLVNELLNSFKKEVQVKTSTEGVFMNAKREKRLFTATEDESPRKRFK